MMRNDSILEMVEEDVADQQALITEQEQLVILLRSAGLPTRQAEERLEQLLEIHMKCLELKVALDPQRVLGLHSGLH